MADLDKGYLSSAEEAAKEIEVSLERMREALDAGRYVEAEGWAGSAKEAAEGLADNVGSLAAGERIRAFGGEPVV